MNVFMQGMRRSGTTIVYDILSQDKNFDLYYEPFAAGRTPKPGGGSGIQKIDLFEKIRKCREAFQKNYPSLKDVDMLNYGTPRDASLELENDLPQYCIDYLKYLISRSEDTVIKFTRMYTKIPVLKRIDPDSKLILILRDPRAITTSYIFGRDQKHIEKFSTEKLFFETVTQKNPWGSYELYKLLTKTPEYTHMENCGNYLRVLMIWKYTFQQAYRTGKKLFGKKFFLLRHEDLISQPYKTLQLFYDFLERKLPENVLNWATEHVQKKTTLFAPDSKFWKKGFEILNMKKELEQAGYDDCIKIMNT
ncbi:MAG: sulfotransferase [Candidatus Kuenenia sp.]|nr:sulfotransferase [Candidatus Kuenenia hertensis]